MHDYLVRPAIGQNVAPLLNVFLWAGSTKLFTSTALFLRRHGIYPARYALSLFRLRDPAAQLTDHGISDPQGRVGFATASAAVLCFCDRF